MSETPLSAMDRFANEMRSLTDIYSPIGKTQDQVIADAFTLLRPFLVNPEGHEKAVKMLIRGFGLNSVRLAMEPLSRMMRSPLLRRLRSEKNFSEMKSAFLEDLDAAQADLKRSLTPVELDADILPLTTKTMEGTSASPTLRLAVFRTNVSIYRPQFTVQSLSIRLKVLDPNLQFVDVEPSSRTETIGGYEVDVTEAGKFVQSRKDTGKITLTVDGQLAKVQSETGNEENITKETSHSASAKKTGQYIEPMVISSAIRETAQWELLRTPTQPLLGGFSFLATAFIPAVPRPLLVDLKVAVELHNWGQHALTLQRVVSS